MVLRKTDDPLQEQDVLAALHGVKDPELGKDLVELKMIQDVNVEGGRLNLTVELTTPACPLKGKIETDVRAALAARLPQLQEVNLHFSARVRSSGAGQGGIPGVKNVFAVGSGKGGVGKSTIAAAVAFGLNHFGAKVGLLDADLYGPSVPHLLGLEGAAPPAMTGDKMQPLEVNGVRVMSVAFIPGAERGRPMIVRGPILHRLIQQFLQQVDWGELDYLVIDLPPTTGDVPLSLSQLLPLTGGVIVCTPQDVALIDAERALNMFRQLKVPVLGIVENMSYFLCPHCSARTEIFGTGGAQLMAERERVPFLGAIPIYLQLRTSGDEGRFADLFAQETPLRAALLSICQQAAAQISVQNFAQPEIPSLEF